MRKTEIGKYQIEGKETRKKSSGSRNFGGDDGANSAKKDGFTRAPSTLLSHTKIPIGPLLR